MPNETYHPRGVLIHGYKVRNHPLYPAWAGMKQRCKDSTNASYGGRGITYCDRWKVFVNFAEDMWPKPPNMSLERKDNNAGYSSDNCVWATRKEQSRNRRTFKNSKTGLTGIIPVKNGFNARYDDDGVRYNLGYFDTAEEAAERRKEFIRLYEKNDPRFYDLLNKDDIDRLKRGIDRLKRGNSNRRLRRDSKTGVRGITVHSQGFLVRKTVNGERIYIGFSTTFEKAVEMLRGSTP